MILKQTWIIVGLVVLVLLIMIGAILITDATPNSQQKIELISIGMTIIADVATLIYLVSSTQS